MKRHLVIAATAATIGIAGLGAGVAHAATSTTTKTNPMSNLVDAIATKFNLNKADVQQVFDTQKTQMQAEREADVKTKLAKLVTDGKLTQAQSDAITAKRAEFEATRTAKRDAQGTETQAERKAAMQAEKASLDAWAKTNGIDAQYLRLVMGGGGHGGPGGPRGSMGAPDDQDSSAATTQ